MRTEGARGNGLLRMVAEEVVQFDDGAEGDLRRAEGLPDEFRAAQNVAYRFALLAGAAQLVHVAARFHQLFVAEIDRHEGERSRQAAPVRVESHLQHPGTRRQQPPGAGASAFDEVLHRVAAPEHLVDVLRKHRRVDAVAAKAPAHEERAAATQQAAHDRHVQVVASGDVRKHQPLLVEDVGEQQVVDVRAMARHVDQRMRLRDGRDDIDAAHVDAFVDATPEPAQQPVEETHGGIRHVRGNRQGGIARTFLGFAPRSLAVVGGIRGDCRGDLGAA